MTRPQILLLLLTLVLLGRPALAQPMQLASQVDGLNAVALSALPETAPRPERSGRMLCALEDEDIKTPAGRAVAQKNWYVTQEVARDDLTFVSFAAGVEAGTSGSCLFSDGNVGIFRGADLLGLVYASEAGSLDIGRILDLEGDRLRIWSGGILSTPFADLQIVSESLIIVREVAAQDSFCAGAVTVPNIYLLRIDIAGQVLLANDWSTRPTTSGQSDLPTDTTQRSFPEPDSCSGTGFGFCAFTYYNQTGQSLRVVTAGGFSPQSPPSVTFISVQCGAE